MAIISIQPGQAGLVGVLPSVAYINTNDPMATVTATGYLNHEVQQGVQFSLPCLAEVSTQESSTSPIQVSWFQIAHVGNNWSLVTANGMVSPGIANEIAIYAASGHTIEGLANAPDSVLVTNNSSIPSLSTALPAGITVPSPSAGNQVANKAYVDAISGASSLTCYAASTANLTGYTYNNGASGVGATLTAGSNGAFVLDSVTVPLNQPILYKNDTTGSGAYNGIYTLTQTGSISTPAILTRATYFNSPSLINGSGVVAIQNGTVNEGTGWLNSSIVVTVGVSPIVFVPFGLPAGILPPNLGGTGENNGTNTLTLGGNTTFSGAHTFTGTLTANTAITFPTVGTLASQTQVQQNMYNFAVSTGSADAFVVDLTPAILAMSDGMLVTLTANMDNTTATPTLKLNTMPAKPIVIWSGNLMPFDIQQNNTYLFVYSLANDNFTLINPSISIANTELVQANFYNYGLDSGATNAYVVTLIPSPIGSFLDSMPVFFTVFSGHTNTGAATLTVNGTTNPILTLQGSALTGGEILSNTISHVLYTSNFGGAWLLQNSAVDVETGVQTVSGTANRITSTGGQNPVIDIDAAYVGQSSITTLGTVSTGTWQGSTISATYGGTGLVTPGLNTMLVGSGSGVLNAVNSQVNSVWITDGFSIPQWQTLANNSVLSANNSGAIGSLGYSSASSASSLVLRDANQNAFANNFVSKATNVSSAGTTTTLTAASSRIQTLTGTLAQTFKLPDATTLSVGSTWYFNNNSTGTLSIIDNGSNPIATVLAGAQAYVIAIAVSTSNGAWDYHFLIPANSSWGTVGLTTPGYANINNLIRGYTTTATAGATTTLTATSTYYQYFTGTLTQTVVMPVVSTLIVGEEYFLVNNSTGAVTVNSSGGNLIAVMPQNSTLRLICILNSGTTAASWSSVAGYTSAGKVDNGTTGQIAYYAASGQTVDGNPATLDSSGNLTVLSSHVGFGGTAGLQTLNAPTAGKGFMSFLANDNAGNFGILVENQSYGQSTTLSIPDPANASAEFMINTRAGGSVPTLTAFTPQLGFSGTTTGITYTTQQGFYTQIGNVINFSIHLLLSSKGSTSGNATIAGLPVVANASVDFQTVVASYNTLSYIGNSLVAQIPASSNFMNLIQQQSAVGQVELDDTAFSNTTEIFISGSYII